MKTLGSSIMLSASSEICWPICSLTDWVSREALKGTIGDESKSDCGVVVVVVVILPGPFSSVKSVDAEDLCAWSAVSGTSDEPDIDLANDLHFASSDCTPSSDGGMRAEESS